MECESVRILLKHMNDQCFFNLDDCTFNYFRKKLRLKVTHFFNKVALGCNLNKKETGTQLFSYESCKIFKNFFNRIYPVLLKKVKF